MLVTIPVSVTSGTKSVKSELISIDKILLWKKNRKLRLTLSADIDRQFGNPDALFCIRRIELDGHGVSDHIFKQKVFLGHENLKKIIIKHTVCSCVILK